MGGDAQSHPHRRTHTRVRICSRFRRPAVRSNHERWDGGGYPDKLAGEDIPLGARIIAVCDAYEAMVEDRPWCSPKTPDEALAELRRCAGTQFDPQLVDAFAGQVFPELHQPTPLTRG